MDALLRNVSTGHGALDIAIGEGLDSLNVAMAVTVALYEVARRMARHV